jgi:hypothetical protein
MTLDPAVPAPLPQVPSGSAINPMVLDRPMLLPVLDANALLVEACSLGAGGPEFSARSRPQVWGRERQARARTAFTPPKGTGAGVRRPSESLVRFDELMRSLVAALYESVMRNPVAVSVSRLQGDGRRPTGGMLVSVPPGQIRLSALHAGT